jgi:hypothetical protein
VAIGVVSILLALGSLVVGILGVMLYRQRERQHQKATPTLHIQRDIVARSTIIPNAHTYIWPQRNNIIFILFAVTFRRPVLLAPFHLRRAATWGTLHSDPSPVGSLGRQRDSHLSLPINGTYPTPPPACLTRPVIATDARK